MIELSREFSQELKTAIENVYMLSKKINLSGKQSETCLNNPQSQNAIKFIQEEDEKERPYLYYHYQNGFFTSEIQKIRKGYTVKTNYDPRNKINSKEFTEDSTITIKSYGNNSTYLINTETLEEAKINFNRTVANLLQRKSYTKEFEIF